MVELIRIDTGYNVKCNGYSLVLNDRNVLNNGKRIKERWQLVSLFQSMSYGTFRTLNEVKNYVLEYCTSGSLAQEL